MSTSLDIQRCLDCNTFYVRGEQHACTGPVAPSSSSIDTQVGGDHYKRFEIQPIEFITKNKLPFAEGNVIKYICRHPYKGGAEDVRKAIQYCRQILEFTYGEKPTNGG